MAAKYNVVYRPRGGKSIRVGTVWENDSKGGGTYLSLKPELESGEYTMAFSKALEAFAKGEGFFNLYEAKPRKRRDEEESDFATTATPSWDD